jgi:predicted dehydrogenase
MSKLRIGVIGAGRMGGIRAMSAHQHEECELVQVVDVQEERARTLAAELGCDSGKDWQMLVARTDVDAVAVSTPHNLLAPISVAALQSGKHVFVEKPMARTVEEAQDILAALQSARSISHDRPQLVVGCTLRHHSNISRAKELVKSGAIGQPYYLRGLYGHGGRPGYDREWRIDPQVGGGGELLDQGVHLIDLSRWFLGEICEIRGAIDTCYWTGSADSDPSVKPSLRCRPGQAEDNAFLILSTAIGQVAFLHASWTQWKNIFSFEIYGRDGAIAVTGLGGHYGEEKLLLTTRRPEGGVPIARELPLDYSEVGQDVWSREWQAFVCLARPCDSNFPVTSPASALDGLAVLRIVHKVYESGRRPGNVHIDDVTTMVAH